MLWKTECNLLRTKEEGLVVSFEVLDSIMSLTSSKLKSHGDSLLQVIQ